MNWLFAVPLQLQENVEVKLDISYKGAIIVKIKTTEAELNYLIEDQQNQKIVVAAGQTIIGIEYSSYYSEDLDIATNNIEIYETDLLSEQQTQHIETASLLEIFDGLSTYVEDGVALNSWDQYPDILIFDFDTYQIQADFFKRLAFFAEKPGYVGRLLTDAELSGKHGWNAHDYSTKTLSNFFTLARKNDFNLNSSEIWLENMLITRGLIVPYDGGFLPGDGAIISISKETYSPTRSIFLIHEICHALFFTQEEFTNEMFEYWNSLPEDVRSAFRLFLMHNFYDPNDEYLMVNEFFAYIAQQPIDETANYLTYKFRRVVELHPETYYQVNEFLDNYPDIFNEASIKIDNLLNEYFALRCGNFF